MNMDEKSDSDKSFDDFMMPGFRFHPTDEELVEFYLKRKLQNRPLPIELIKQVDIYKYDPWDLPKVASTGEKEWYFYCPRDRKYRNSTRPNRVTGSGFWKATGTDRPIYSSDGNKCIGLKKSLVFYRGRAARGMKTDWMMHEFRLPAAPDGGAPPPLPPKRVFDKNIPATDSWAICRIFKKTISMANRALSHSWAASFSETTPTCALTYANFNSENDLQQALNFPSYKNLSAATGKTSALTSANFDYFPENIIFSPSKELSDTSKNTTLEITPTIFNLSPAIPGEANFETPPHEFNGGYSVNVEDDQDGFKKNQSTTNVHNIWENVRSIGFPFSLPPALPWDSPACPSEISSASYSTNRCYI